VSIVWIGVERDELVTGHLYESLKVKNLRRDPRAMISMESQVVQQNGLQQHLIAQCSDPRRASTDLRSERVVNALLARPRVCVGGRT
jgi:hypothetical protein